MGNKTEKLWGGRFKRGTHPEMEKFSESLHFDKRLSSVDVRASIAHARMLGRQGIISKRDDAAIVRGLKKIEREIKGEKFRYRPELEDIHTNIERRLVELIGSAGEKLHTGRSRNDQVATDLRLWLREKIDEIRSQVSALTDALLNSAEKHADTLMPGYTHLQRAQPVTFGHHLLAYAAMLERDDQRLAQCRSRTNVLPLGAGALAGSTLPLNPVSVAKELGFEGVFDNSIDAVSDRDFAVEFIFAAALCHVHFSRMAEEFVLWTSSEFGFIELPENFMTGSSIMPQKRNPDSAELIRGKSGRMIGNLTAILTMLKGLPLAYNRDMQEDKEPVFDAADTLLSSLTIMTHLIRGLKVNKAALKCALKEGYIEATDLAEYLVEKKMPFRQAHKVVGKLVQYASARGKKLGELSLQEYRNASDLFDNDLFDRLDMAKSVRRRKNHGGPGTVRQQIKKLRDRNIKK